MSSQIEDTTSETQLKDLLNSSEDYDFRFDLGITDTTNRDKLVSCTMEFW